MSVSLEARKHWDDITFVGEAKELHEYLDDENVPHKVYSEHGKHEDEKGKYHLMPLIDRITIFFKKKENS
jgi:hypothetical protein